jgi:hypothetical protein
LGRFRGWDSRSSQSGRCLFATRAGYVRLPIINGSIVDGTIRQLKTSNPNLEQTSWQPNRKQAGRQDV